MTPAVSPEEAVASVKATYNPKIEALLNRLADEVKTAGWQSSPAYDMSEAETRFTMYVENEIEASVTLVEELQNAANPKLFGINFDLSLYDGSGNYLGSVCPANYTPGAWVDSQKPEDVKARWQEFVKGVALEFWDLLGPALDALEKASVSV